MGPLEAFDRFCAIVSPLHSFDEYVRLKDIVRRTLTGPPMHMHLAIDSGKSSTIRIMERGSTLCGIHTRPVDWPPNEEWVPMEAAESATCIRCVDKYVKRQP